MPIYEFICDACGYQHEHFAKSMGDPVPQECPKCDSKSLRKTFSLFASVQGSPDNSVRQGGCGRCGDPHGPCS